jgi:ligand-binding SRPBCC domain-containing protein
MPVFRYQFSVAAPLEAVDAFHHAPGALQKLTPPGIRMQVRLLEPLAERSVASFVLWFGYIFPVPWRAVHHDVSATGFYDTQVEGPMQRWVHTHRFTALTAHTTLIQEHIDYTHRPGWPGVGTRLLFSPLGLWLLFSFRKVATRWQLRSLAPTHQNANS